MSIAVSLEDLAGAVAPYPWGYLVTVGPDVRAHVLAASTDLRDGVFHVAGGRSSRANASERPEVTLVFPHPEAGEYTLIVEGNAAVAGDDVQVTPTKAILHRPAP